MILHNMVLDDTPLLVLDDCVHVLDDTFQILDDIFWVLGDSGEEYIHRRRIKR